MFLSFLDPGSISCLSEYTYGTENLKKKKFETVRFPILK